jgi:hypothetical protein
VATTSKLEFQSYLYIYFHFIDLRMAEEPRQVEAGPSSQLPSGFEKWRSSLSQFTGLGLTDEQRADREADKANGVLARDWDRCEKWKKELLERSKSFSRSFAIADDRSNGSIHAQAPSPRRLSIPRRRIPMSSLSYYYLWRILASVWDLVMSG